jgi:hypothetical protein
MMPEKEIGSRILPAAIRSEVAAKIRDIEFSDIVAAVRHMAFVIPEGSRFTHADVVYILNVIDFDTEGCSSAIQRLYNDGVLVQQERGARTTGYHMERRARQQYKAKYSAREEGPLVAFIEAGKPRTAHLELAKLFTSLAGDLRICDPYYGSGSLLRLDLLKHCNSIKFLTRNPDSAERTTLPRALVEFVKEHLHVEFRQHKAKDLHDRFILSDSELILLGHGLKDVGNKDSFVVRIDRHLASDMLDALQVSFDTKWQAASPL